MDNPSYPSPKTEFELKFPIKGAKFLYKLLSNGKILITYCDPWILGYFGWSFDSNNAVVRLSDLVASSHFPDLTKELFSNQRKTDFQMYVNKGWVYFTSEGFNGSEFKWHFTLKNEKPEVLFESRMSTFPSSNLLDSLIFNSSPDGIIITDLTGIIKMVNQPILQVIKADNAAAIIGRNLVEFVHVDDQEKVALEIQHMFAGIFKGAATYKSCRINGEVFYNEVNAQFIRDIDGNPEHIIFFTREVTEKVIEDQKQIFSHHFQKHIADFSSAFFQVESDNFDAFIQKELEKLGNIFEVDRVFIFELNKNETHFNNTFEWCAPHIFSCIDKLQEYDLSGVPFFEEAVRLRQKFYIPNVDSLDHETEQYKVLHDQCIQSLLMVPMFRSDVFKGYLGFDCVKFYKHFDDDIINLIELLGAVMGDAFARNRFEATLIERNKTLKQSENQFKLISQNTSDGILVISKNFKIDYVSETYIKLFGFKNEHEFRNKVNRVGQLIAPSHTEEVLTYIYDSIAENREKITYRYLALMQDGSEVWREDSTSFVYNSQGNFLKAYIVCRDIHQRVLSELEMTKLNETLKLASKTAGLGLWTYTFDNQIFKFDDQMSHLFGFDENLEKAIHYHDFLTVLHPDDAPNLDAYIDQIIEKDTLYNDAIFRVRLPDHTYRHVKATGQIFRDARGVPLSALGMCYDISDIKIASSQVERLSKVQGLLIDIAARYINLEPDEVDMGIQNAFELIGNFANADRVYIFQLQEDKKYYIYTHEWCAKGISSHIHNPEVNRAPRKLIDDSFDSRGIETFIVKDVNLLEESNFKSVLLVQEIKSCAMHPIIVNGEYTGFVGFDFVTSYWTDEANNVILLKVFSQILANLYRKVALERTLVAEKEKAFNASLAKSQFLANMSHEIRTPLNGVLGFSELLEQTNLDAVQKQYIDSIKTSGKSLLGIINDILDFSKIEAGRLDLDLTEVSPIHIVEEVADLMKILASQKGLEFLLDVPLSLPQKALFDPLRIKQVLVNILHNAIKFTASGTVTLQLTYQDTSIGRGLFHFCIKDTGIGIKEEDRHKLFKAFSQADNTTTRRFGGTGLGLIISNLLVSKMNGKIDFESTYGLGSNFFFTVETQVIDEGVLFESDDQGIISALLVDDHEGNLQILHRHFNYLGIRADLCSHATQAIQKLTHDSTYGAVFIDCTMPDISGVELVNLIRNRLKFSARMLPIVLMCADQPSEEMKANLGAKGIQYVINKPIKPSELKDTLKKLLRHEAETQVVEDKPKLGEDLKDISATVVIAEDNKTSMLLMRTILKKWLPQAQIIEATNGIEAFQAFVDYQPDLILMDVQMPEMDGLETTRVIRDYEEKSKKQPIVIALTAGALKEEEQRCFESGMDAFLTKPVQQTELVEIFVKYLK